VFNLLQHLIISQTQRSKDAAKTGAVWCRTV